MHLDTADGEGVTRPDLVRAIGDIFEGCPVKALGVRGRFGYFTDVLGQVHALDALSLHVIIKLFGGNMDPLIAAFPVHDSLGHRKNDQPDINRTITAMWRAAYEKGLIDDVRLSELTTRQGRPLSAASPCEAPAGATRPSREGR